MGNAKWKIRRWVRLSLKKEIVGVDWECRFGVDRDSGGYIEEVVVLSRMALGSSGRFWCPVWRRCWWLLLEDSRCLMGATTMAARVPLRPSSPGLAVHRSGTHMLLLW